MPLTVESSRFGAVRIAERDAIEFPLGLLGLPGSRYALLDPKPGGRFLWLHSLEDPTLALPVVDPRAFFPSFAIQPASGDGALVGDPSAPDVRLYVTVTARAEPLEVTVNLRAPLVIRDGVGQQVINVAAGAELRVPLLAGAGGGSPAAGAA